MYASGPLGKILLIDDDQNIVDLLKFNLSSEGFAVETMAQAKDATPDRCADARMAIVDAMQQPYSGVDFTREIKSNPATSDLPVIICTARSGEDMLVEAFDAGADDFVSKPFSLRELVARVKAVLRRHPIRQSQRQSNPANPALLEFPALRLVIDTANQRVTLDGEAVPLTKTEFAILNYLIKNQNSFFTRDEICLEVWKDEAGSNARIVDTNISRLRKKLGETGKCIINRYGMGYAFVSKPA